MNQKNKFVNKLTQAFKGIAFAALVYAVLIAAVFCYAAVYMIKLWMLPVAVAAFSIISAEAAYEDRRAFKGYIEAFNHRLVELVTWYIEVGTK